MSKTFQKEILITAKASPKVPKTKIIKTQEVSIKDGKPIISVGVSSGEVGSILDQQFNRDILSDFSRGINIGREENLYGKEIIQARTTDSLGTFQEQDVTTRFMPKVGQGEVSKIILRVNEFNKGFQGNKIVQKPLPRTNQGLAQTPKLIPKLFLKTTSTTKQTTTTPPPTPRPKPEPKKIITKKPLPEKTMIPKPKKEDSKEKPFEIFGRRYGKDISLKKVKTIQQAEDELERFLKGTLGAGGFVERGGKRIKIDLGTGFRPSKVEPKRVIQKRRKRLSAPSERREIKSARRKGGNIKWF